MSQTITKKQRTRTRKTKRKENRRKPRYDIWRVDVARTEARVRPRKCPGGCGAGGSP
ncbi:hypothetical protein V6Z11_D10G079300 [Gossypium hirsutum]